MCKIISEVKKVKIGVVNHKRKKSFNEGLLKLYKSGFLYFNQRKDSETSFNYPTESGISINSLTQKRERSRIAAKRRRCQESDNLTQLYMSLPVSSKSRLLCCDDNHFIGNFEKATIIKVAAYVLKLYNSLSDLHYFDIFNKRIISTVSIFSQSFFGLFWCENSKKLIFTTPGLARLTGLYWCNMIGMPLNSIIEDYSHQDFNKSLNMIFLRFMMKSLKEHGIFTVHPSKQKSDDYDDAEDKISLTKGDMIGKIPCSLWSSGKFKNGVQFKLIQPLISKTKKRSIKIIKVNCTKPSVDRVRINSDLFDETQVKYRSFSTYHSKDMLKTVAIEEDFVMNLGYRIEDIDNTILFSFFCLFDIVTVDNQLRKLLSGEAQRSHTIVRLGTGKKGVYRWALCCLEFESDQNVPIFRNLNTRSSLNHGEAYTQNVVDALKDLDEKTRFINSEDKGDSNLLIKATFDLKGYYSDGVSTILEEASMINDGPCSVIKSNDAIRDCSNEGASSFQYLFGRPPDFSSCIIAKNAEAHNSDTLDFNMNNQLSNHQLPTEHGEYSDNMVSANQNCITQPRQSILLTELLKRHTDQ